MSNVPNGAFNIGGAYRYSESMVAHHVGLSGAPNPLSLFDLHHPHPLVETKTEVSLLAALAPLNSRSAAARL